MLTPSSFSFLLISSFQKQFQLQTVQVSNAPAAVMHSLDEYPPNSV